MNNKVKGSKISEKKHYLEKLKTVDSYEWVQKREAYIAVKHYIDKGVIFKFTLKPDRYNNNVYSATVSSEVIEDTDAHYIYVRVFKNGEDLYDEDAEIEDGCNMRASRLEHCAYITLQRCIASDRKDSRGCKKEKEKTSRSENKLTLYPTNDFLIKGTAVVELWGGGGGSLNMKDYEFSAKDMEEFKELILKNSNDNGFGVQSIKCIQCNVYRKYDFPKKISPPDAHSRFLNLPVLEFVARVNSVDNMGDIKIELGDVDFHE